MQCLPTVHIKPRSSKAAKGFFEIASLFEVPAKAKKLHFYPSTLDMEMTVSNQIFSTFKTIYGELNDKNIHWILTGSLSFFIRGMNIEVHDIDLQTDKKGAYAIEKIFKRNSIVKVEYKESKRIRSYFGSLEIDGILVEIMGDVEKKVENHWLESPQIDNIKEIYTFQGLDIPVLPLRYEAEAYKQLGRYDKAERIRAMISKR